MLKAKRARLSCDWLGPLAIEGGNWGSEQDGGQWKVSTAVGWADVRGDVASGGNVWGN